MKRNTLMLILGGVIVAIALGCMLLFVLSGNDGGEPAAKTIDLEGTWKIASCCQAGMVTLPESEYYVFSGTTASAYRNGESTPYVTSSFELSATSAYADLEMKLPDLSRSYEVSILSDNCIRMYENSDVYMELIRCSSDDRSEISFSEDIVIGNWDVVYRNTTDPIVDEKVTLENGMLHDYRNGSTEPFASAPYYWNESGYLCVDALNAELRCIPMSEDLIFFVEVRTGNVWELKAA